MIRVKGKAEREGNGEEKREEDMATLPRLQHRACIFFFLACSEAQQKRWEEVAANMAVVLHEAYEKSKGKLKKKKMNKRNYPTRDSTAEATTTEKEKGRKGKFYHGELSKKTHVGVRAGEKNGKRKKWVKMRSDTTRVSFFVCVRVRGALCDPFFCVLFLTVCSFFPRPFFSSY